ncbi:MAG: nuclear transport factor 2 family protein [Bacteroidetes bacterium]|nr:nuclear transport factor 2 family protein [Bacteroidota bacterium]
MRTAQESTSEITALLHSYYEAFHRRDWDAFARPLAAGFRYFTDHATIQSRDAFVSCLKNDPWEPVSYSMSELAIIVSASNDVAYATYCMQFDGRMSGTVMSIRALETAVFERTAGEWKLVHFHSSNKEL